MTTEQESRLPATNYNSFHLQLNYLKGIHAHRFILKHIKHNMMTNPRLFRKIKRDRKRRMSLLVNKPTI